jgi:hypothetical protein
VQESVQTERTTRGQDKQGKIEKTYRKVCGSGTNNFTDWDFTITSHLNRKSLNDFLGQFAKEDA